MNIFIKKKQIKQQPKKEERPEFHKCPVCFKENKTASNNLENYKEKYLDGRRKAPFNIDIECYNMCSCGAIYYVFKEEKTDMTDKTRDIILTDEYFKIIKDKTITDETYRKLLLMQYVNDTLGGHYVGINQMWLDYYREHNNQEKVQEFLIKRIEETNHGIVLGCYIYNNQSILELKEGDVFRPTRETVLIDLYRQAGMFNESKKLIMQQQEIYKNLPDNPNNIFYKKELELLEQYNKSHI